MGTCLVCAKKDPTVSSFLQVCGRCIKENFSKVKDHIYQIHREIREEEDEFKTTFRCYQCVNRCFLNKDNRGRCGLPKNLVTANQAFLEYYFDPIPTNCVGEKFCGATGCGYPEFSYTPYIECGCKNLAVFFYGCTFNCLFCQNYSWRNVPKEPIDVETLVEVIDDRTSCVCFFGGDPSSQIIFSINLSYQALRKKKGKILRICWETNGSFDARFRQDILHILKISGGMIKFDLKFFDENLNIALCGTSNRATLENFSYFAENFRKVPPLVCASTLIIPGYVDDEEVGKIARFISQFNREIPYVLLGFWPQFYFKDIPPTSKQLMEKCFLKASKYLKNVVVGNTHLLT